MTRRKTDAEFKKEVFDLVGDEYVFLDSYQESRTKIKVKHNKCGHIYEVQPSNFLSGKRCPYCKYKAKKTNAEFKKEVYDLVGNEYTFLDPYVNNHTKLRVKHNKCGHIYEVIPGAFLSGNRCSYCFNESQRKTNAQFKQEVRDLVGDEYTFLDPYVNNHTKLRVKHNKCGYIYRVQPGSFFNGSRCSYCVGNFNKTDEQFKQEVYDLVGNEYTFLDSYVNNHTKLRVKHNKCRHIYKVQPSIFFNGSRCPYCKSPKGEVAINKLLKSLGINYEYQKTFDDLVDKANLSYDFYISSQHILIEYQGRQHYEPVDIFGGKKQFKLQQKHDKMKADYAKTNNYNLISIPYTEDTCSKIKNYLIKHGLKLH